MLYFKEKNHTICLTSPPGCVNRICISPHHDGPQNVKLTQQEKAMRRNVICGALIIFLSDGFPFASLSEPSVMLLLGFCLIGLAGFAKKKIEDVKQDSIARDRKEERKGTHGSWA